MSRLPLRRGHPQRAQDALILLVLGIESSCDETAAAVVAEGTKILSSTVSSQVEVHRPYGGVVPELASRHHLKNVVPVVRDALARAGTGLEDLDGIAVTQGPGLVGALLVGIQVAKGLSYVAQRPLVGVNHLEGHLFSPRLRLAGTDPPQAGTDPQEAGTDPQEAGTDPSGTDPQEAGTDPSQEAGTDPSQEAGTDPPQERHIALLVSGGHTALILVEGFGRYRVLGRSRDDAAGEAFDKVSKLLGMGYPGGPIIESLARSGDPNAIRFPRALMKKGDLDFSFSGLKTAVANHVREHGAVTGTEVADLCASVQAAVADVLVRKALRAVKRHRVGSLVAGGGVMANTAIRRALEACAAQSGFKLSIPPIDLCTDNGAMIAAAGTEHLKRGRRSGLELNASPRLPL